MKITTVKELGVLVKKERKCQGMTQAQLAGACGTGVRFIVDLEKGKDTCATGKALLVVKMLGITLTAE